MKDFTEREQLLFEGQFGFRNNQSTTDALINITKRIRSSCDKGLYACGAFLDFKKTFDTVNHIFFLVNLHTMELEAKLIIGFTHI